MCKFASYPNGKPIHNHALAAGLRCLPTHTRPATPTHRPSLQGSCTTNACPAAPPPHMQSPVHVLVLSNINKQCQTIPCHTLTAVCGLQ